MPYQCRHCGGTFCADHRLPENHGCPGLESWGEPGGGGGAVFDSGFDDNVVDESGSGGIAERLGIDTGPGGALGYFRGNMTYVFLGAMWITFFLQIMVLSFGSQQLHQTIFVIHPNNPEYVWTWVTSIFSHAPGSLFHIAGNSIIIFFFGRIVEQYIGSRDFTLLFLGSGILAGLGQITIQAVQGDAFGALGASGAALAIMAVLTVLNPNLRVILLIPPVPVPIWIITGFYALLSITGALGGLGGSGFLGGVAHVAHGVGLLIGFFYGYRVKGKIATPSQMQMGSGRRGPGGPGGPGGRGPF